MATICKSMITVIKLVQLLHLLTAPSKMVS